MSTQGTQVAPDPQDGSNRIDGGPLRVLVADDQPIVRSGLTMVLGTEPGIEVVGEVTDGAQAIELARRLAPDLVLMDVQMPGTDGIEATRTITSSSDTRVVVLTTFDRDDYLFAALEAGASGFLLKMATPEELVAAVRAVGSGQALLSPEVTLPLIRRVAGMPGESREGAPEHGLAGEGRTGKAAGGCASSPDAVEPGAGAEPDPAREAEREEARRRLATLTPRETQILGLMAQGLSNGEIAAAEFLSEATVKTHVSNVLMKLGLRDRVQAVVAAYETGLVRAGERSDT